MSSPIVFEAVSLAIGGIRLLEAVSFGVEAGEVVGLLGANGSGKTTLMRAALGVMRPLAGEVRLDGRAVTRWSERQRAERLAWLPQEGRVGWNLPAVEVAALGAPFAPPALARRWAREALARVGLADFADRGVQELSTGERARVLFARLLTTRAPVILADEPVAAMDVGGGPMIMNQLREEAGRGAAVLVSLHDLALAARACDRVAVLAAGRLCALGPPKAALSPEVVAKAFGVRIAWVETEGGPMLAL